MGSEPQFRVLFEKGSDGSDIWRLKFPEDDQNCRKQFGLGVLLVPQTSYSHPQAHMQISYTSLAGLHLA